LNPSKLQNGSQNGRADHIKLTASVGSSGVRRNFSWGGVDSVAYGGHLYLVCAFCYVTIWRHSHISKPTFWRGLLT